jgi:hypothetical protein
LNRKKNGYRFAVKVRNMAGNFTVSLVNFSAEQAPICRAFDDRNRVYDGENAGQIPFRLQLCRKNPISVGELWSGMAWRE